MGSFYKENWVGEGFQLSSEGRQLRGRKFLAVAEKALARVFLE
jgi:hypothetical protein